MIGMLDVRVNVLVEVCLTLVSNWRANCWTTACAGSATPVSCVHARYRREVSVAIRARSEIMSRGTRRLLLTRRRWCHEGVKDV